MPDTIELIIAASARRLLARLYEPGRAPDDDDSAARDCGFFAARPLHVPQRIWDAAGAQRLATGNFMLPHEAGTDPAAWAVLVPLEFQRESGFVAFRLRGLIHTALDPAAFIETSYRTVLNRPADADGVATYLSGLAAKTLSHAALLRALASSAEAGSQHETLLIYPFAEPSAPAGGSETAMPGEFDCILISKETFAGPAE